MHYKTLVVAEIDRSASFVPAVYNEVEKIMEPYCTEAEEYFEFVDLTDMLRSDYEQSVECLKLPDGKIVELCSFPYYGKYCILDGKVYQNDAGPLNRPKRTKKSKKITALQNYPRAKIYKSFENYVENYRGFSLDDEHLVYGYYCNPKARWDGYQIGGRWPNKFLVKTDCKEKIFFEDFNKEAPEGYIWVTAARKKDICWNVMSEWMKRAETEEIQISSHKYPLEVSNIVDNEIWFSKGTGDEQSSSWQAQIDEYIAALDDEAVLVGVDVHS